MSWGFWYPNAHIQMAEGYFGVSFHLSVSIFNLSAVKSTFSYFTFVWHWTSCNLTTLIWKSGSLNLLEPSEPHQACYGTPLPFYWTSCLTSFTVLCIVCFTWHCWFWIILQNFWWLYPWCTHYRSRQWTPTECIVTSLISYCLWLICVCAPGWCSLWIGGRVGCLLSRPTSYFPNIRHTMRGVLVQ